MSDQTSAVDPSLPDGRQDHRFFGHPWALATLFSTELWERFSFYGMRAILVLFLTASVANDGWGWDKGDANALYGVYNGMVYLMALPGAWLADRIIGARRSVLWGGVVIACGHYLLAIPAQPTFFIGLIFIVLGTGLLKPNMSAMVGDLYTKDDPRRDAGFSLFYMGINLGAFIAPLVTAALASKMGWHWGFAAAGVGMTIAVIWYITGGRSMGALGRQIEKPLQSGEAKRLLMWIGVAAVVIAIVAVVMAIFGALTVSNVVLILVFVPILVTFIYFGRMFKDKSLDDVERSRLKAYIWIFVAAATFWLLYDQAGSVLTLFTEDDVNRNVPVLGELSAATFQAINPIFIIIGSPLAAVLWLKLGSRLSTPVKFAVGLILNGFSFILMGLAAMAAVGGNLVSPWWIVAVYAVQVAGELSLSPVGLSATTKLAPRGYLSQMLGLWFLATAVGDAIGGQLAKLSVVLSQELYFIVVGAASVLLGVAAVTFTRSLSRLMRGIH